MMTSSKHLKNAQTTLHIQNIQQYTGYFFDDIDHVPFTHSGIITVKQAENVIDFLDYQFAHKNFEKVLVHCQAGISRSQAIALFIAKYYLHDEDLFNQLYHQCGKAQGGNKLVYNRLVDAYNKKHEV